jgi:hypothetical protein
MNAPPAVAGNAMSGERTNFGIELDENAIPLI